MDHLSYQILSCVFAFVLGASIGSFLNVCIYRLPRDLSVNRPRRSFCPQCKEPIPWFHNIPLLSWIFLRARCANCGSKISFRYFGVELLTALLFLLVWKTFPWHMVTQVGVPLHEAVAMATDTPAHAIGLTAKGQFKIGGDADFVVISPKLELLRTFIAGEEAFNSASSSARKRSEPK